MNTIIIALIIALLWGISPVIYKLILNDISHHTVLTISGFTFFIATIIYAIINYEKLELKNTNKLIYIALISFF